ncbi:MAG: hypothetical protein ACI841_001598 [Planctomycetota bacterium]|jgi:uncharacterized protein YdhG (YjbR/CyaY superfamily)
MQSQAKSLDRYIAELPEDRREAIKKIRATIKKHLPKGYEEGMQYGMIGYFVPHSIYPDGYHCDPKQPVPFAALASQKNHMAIYLHCVYSDPKHMASLVSEWEKTGKKLNMGKSCIRFKKLEDVPLDVIGKTIQKISVKEYLATYTSAREGTKSQPKKKTAGKKSASKKSASNEAVSKKKSSKKAVVKKAAPKKAVKKTASKKKTARKSASKKAPARKRGAKK